MQQQRYIAHFDLDSFFVSVEVINNPMLKDKAVIVGGSKDRGVVSTCSYEARKYGVRSAMPMKKAMQLCPQAIIVKGTRGEYSRYSRWVTDIIAKEAPLFEKASIDEFYLDLTGMDKYHNVLEWTKQLREKIIAETQLPISFGLASNKMIAKIATDEAKPNGFLFVEPGFEKAFLSRLPINKISGVGESSFEKLKKLNIHFIGDVLNFTLIELETKLGKLGADLFLKAQGISNSIVADYRESKSISCENTFAENIDNEEQLLTQLVKQVERVGFELRQENKLAGCIAVKIRYPNFETVTKQVTIDYTLSDDVFIDEAKSIFLKHWKRNQPIRLLGVRLCDLTNQSFQGNIFDDIPKKSKLYKAIDGVKERFGKQIIQKAVTTPKTNN
jgi:DNA polymerase IV